MVIFIQWQRVVCRPHHGLTRVPTVRVFIDCVYTKGTPAHTHRELIYGGASRSGKGEEALWPPVLKAHRRRTRQQSASLPSVSVKLIYLWVKG